ncbi:MAG TPA: acetoin utilization protein AcuC [Kineosporiaceae bacterium]|jgi:acetoin utilization protein AcuC|nr:acetoin utilization protein AcuC [Kineosporiaceae bacterium]
MEALRLVWDEAFTRYDFGQGHPMSPVRLDLTARLIRELGLFERAGVHVVGAEPASDDVLCTVHEPAYVEAVKAASSHPIQVDESRGLGTDDVPVFEGMHEASARIVAGTVEVARAVWSGQALHGVNFTGGMHHAMPGKASGFCVYNDSAVAIKALLDEGAQRIVYVDIDVHHGDGVERIFWDDPRVMTISLHETGRILFPGTGYANDIGGPRAEGSAVNVAFPPGTSDAPWLRAFHAIVPPLVTSFAPEVMFTQHGCDSHSLDPLAHMALSLDCQLESYKELHDLAHSAAGGRWVAVGGGGYELVDVVPRAWSHLVAVAAHQPIEPTDAVPAAWREYVLERMGRQAPQRMTDGREMWFRSWATGHDPEDAVDRAVMATRKAVFPLHGLDPWFD